jgi:hypothetical protein
MISIVSELSLAFVYTLFCVLGFFLSYWLGKRFFYETWFHKQILKYGFSLMTLLVVVFLVLMTLALFEFPFMVLTFETSFLYLYASLLGCSFLGGFLLPIQHLTNKHSSFTIQSQEVYSLPTLRRRIRREFEKKEFVKKEKRMYRSVLRSSVLLWIVFFLLVLT